MNRRIKLILTSMALLFLAAVLTTAAPKIGLAQTKPLWVGTWKLNLAKSKFLPGPPPKSQTLTFTGEGQNLIDTVDTVDAVDAQGQATKTVFIHIYDGKPHSTTGVAGGQFDGSAYTRVDDHTVDFVRLKDGKAVLTGWAVVSGDGKTYTITNGGIGANGQAVSSIAVYDRQ
jgi:hypothetical protein